MSGVRAGRVGKQRGRRAKAGPVLRMMAIMQDGNNDNLPKEFLEGGRTGRRNAVPDILHPPDAHATTADLPARFQQLAASDPDNPQPGPSTSNAEEKKDEAQKKDSGS